jgi:glycosyltransferase involved in cell wall biosynthesis
VLADPPSHAWLDGCVSAPSSIETFAGAIAADDRKTLLALSPAALAALPPEPLPPHASAAVWLATPEEVYRVHEQLRALPVVAFAADSDVAARAAVFSRTVLPGVPGPEALTIAAQHCANGTFFRRTRDPARLARAVPDPLCADGPLRVLLQVDTFGRGGLERIVAHLATRLLEDGCPVGVLALDGSRGAGLPEGVERVNLAARSDTAYTAMLGQGRWNAVSAHASTFGAGAAAAAGVPFTQTVQNSYVWFERERVEAYRAADPHTSAYVCVSAEALAYTDLRLRLDVQKMVLIENGVDTAPAVPDGARATVRRQLGLTDGDFAFVQVASLQPAKAQRATVRALAAMRAAGSRARLVLLGDEMNPVFAAAVRGDVERLGLTDAVVFAGHRDDPEACMAAADAFVLPSYWEGCSLAVWEAIRAGLPLVLSDVGAAREQMRHGRGELVAPPFASMLELDAGNLDAVTRSVDEAFAGRVAEAMQRVALLPRAAAARLPAIADRRVMATRHRILLQWLCQGGAVPAIRASLARLARGPSPSDLMA